MRFFHHLSARSSMRWTGVETPLELNFTPRNVAFYIFFSPARSLRQKNSERRNKASPVRSVAFMMLLVHFTPCSHCRLYLPLSQMPPFYAAGSMQGLRRICYILQLHKSLCGGVMGVWNCTSHRQIIL